MKGHGSKKYGQKKKMNGRRFGKNRMNRNGRAGSLMRPGRYGYGAGLYGWKKLLNLFKNKIKFLIKKLKILMIILNNF